MPEEKLIFMRVGAGKMSQESFKTVQIVSVFETIFKLNMNTSGHWQQTIMAIHETQSTEDYIIVD